MSDIATEERLYKQAEEYIRDSYNERGIPHSHMLVRLSDIREEINETGTYVHTVDELTYGAKLAWRNSNRCIGRLFWESLSVIDARSVTNTDEMAHVLFRHIREATNEGRIKPMISIFPPASSSAVKPPRVWNHQLIRYAGYDTASGVIGDPSSVAFTKTCLSLGWRGAGTAFDVLPLVLSLEDGEPGLYPIPEELVKEVTIEHPHIEGIRELGLRWYAVPFVADMRLEIGGIQYTAAPFNGWYMGTEIGARNLADENRYDKLRDVAEVMGLDTTSAFTLWKDRALVELNIAVLHSFREHGVTIVDHHTAAGQFKRFQRNEIKNDREVTGRWSWLIPPLSPATTHLFHSSYDDVIKLPNYFYQK
ncbi:nitric oxide synthase oxygenase [Paenibacillus chungangensis]|uniref:Nitric oxide synthase oxygenase n=1 Tax=Paenibacillus chungangensis TaxID=696535 RepID=A0ABW3HN33_9BACL